MKKYILMLILAVGLVGCNSEDVFPDGTTYKTDTYEYFRGIDIWSNLTWDNADFECSGGFIYDRLAPPGTPIADANGTDMQCEPLLEYIVTVTKV